MFEVGDVLVRDQSLPTVDPADQPIRRGPAETWDADGAIESLARGLGFRRWSGPPFLSHVRGRFLEIGTLPLLVCDVRPEVAEGVVEFYVIGEQIAVLEARTQVRSALTGLLGDLGLRWLVSVGLPCLDAHRAWDLAAAKTPDEVPVQNIESLVKRWDHHGPPRPEDFVEVADCGCEGPYLLESLGVGVAGVDEPWSAWCRVQPNRVAQALSFAQGSDGDGPRPAAAAAVPSAIDVP